MIKWVTLFKRSQDTQKSSDFYNTNNNVKTEMEKLGAKPLKCVETLI